MKLAHTLLALVICAYASGGSATTHQPAADTTTTPEVTPKADSPPQISINAEEELYISAECQRFAIDDGVSNDVMPEYLALCISELTIAVKNALMEQHAKEQKRSKLPAKSKSSKSTAKPVAL